MNNTAPEAKFSPILPPVMTKNLYSPDHLLPYVEVQASDLPPKPKERLLHPSFNRNPLATAAFIVSLTSVVSCALLFPSAIGVALGVGALIISFQKKLPKRIPAISIAVSLVTLILGSVLFSLILSATSTKAQPYVPAAYKYDTHSGIAYKYNPLSNFPCDANGVCSFEVKLFAIDPSKCPHGGSFTPDMVDLMKQMKVKADPVTFTPLQDGEERTMKITLKALPNDRVIEQSSYPISCNP